MSNPNKIKGDRFEWDLVNYTTEALEDSELTVERTRAGYARDHGDVLIMLPNNQTLATLQAKNRNRWELPAWLEATLEQGRNVRARYAVLIVKRTRIADVGRSFAIMPVEMVLRLLGELAQREAELAEQHAEMIRLRAS